MTWLRATVAGGLLCLAVWLGLRLAGPPDAGPATTPDDALQRELLLEHLDHPGDPELRALYQRINVEHFDGTLPAIAVAWEARLAEVGELAGHAFRLEGMFGHVGTRAAILLSADLAGDARAVERVLCHEMVHAYLYTVGKSSTGHGPEFQTVLHRLSIEGPFEGLVATDEERARLRSWLDREVARLDAEGRALDSLHVQLDAERAEVERATAALGPAPPPEALAPVAAVREAYNRQAIDANARVDQLQRDRLTLDAEIARYNLMLVYPDGLDDEPYRVTAMGRPASGGR